MQNIIFGIIVCIALAMSVFIAIHTLFRSQSEKKGYFLLMQIMVIVYLFGSLLEITSTNAEEAYTAIRVLYVGSSFVATFAFLFIADYCNIKLHPVFVKTPMVILSLAVIILMWTTRFHHLVYLDYSFNTEYVCNLIFTRGPIYSITHSYPSVCLILAVAVLIHQIRKWDSRYRRQLIILLICIIIPLLTEGIFYISVISGLNKHQFYFTPPSMAIMGFFLYLGVMRFNIFEIISMATVTAMEHIKEGFVLVDRSNNFLSSNPAAAEILPGILKLSNGEPVFSTAGWPEELKDLEKDSVEFSINDGGSRYFRASIGPVLAKNNTLVAKIILLGEITDSVNLMKELENAAYIDSLTGLYNRKHFSELAHVEIERALRMSQSIYTGMLDLDFFKNVNDTFGHAAGDQVLKSTAAIIRQTIRSYDLVGRYGGEEFVLLITDIDPQEAYKLVERIRENMENNITYFEGAEIKITCSIGLAKFVDNDNLDTSIRKSDEALYTAKNSGRNQVQVHKA